MSHAGKGLELFSAVFEPQAGSAWLKCLILKFCLVAQSSLHEAGPLLSESESSVSITSCSGQHSEANLKPQKAKLQTASSNMSSTNRKPLSKKQKQKQNSRAAANANSSSGSPTSAASAASKAAKQQGPPSVQSNGLRRSKKPMAVPAASENQTAAVNGFSAQAALESPSSEGKLSAVSQV